MFYTRNYRSEMLYTLGRGQSCVSKPVLFDSNACASFKNDGGAGMKRKMWATAHSHYWVWTSDQLRQRWKGERWKAWAFKEKGLHVSVQPWCFYCGAGDPERVLQPLRLWDRGQCGGQVLNRVLERNYCVASKETWVQIWRQKWDWMVL